MNKEWEIKFLAVLGRESEQEEKEFLKLLDQTKDNLNLEVMRVLMRSFTNKPDYGTQERVINVMSNGEDELVIQAILEELPRLVVEAPEWAEALIGPEVDNRPTVLSKVALKMPIEIRRALMELLKSKDFQDFYPSANKVTLSL